MSILEKIIFDKKIEVRIKKNLFPVKYLEKFPLFERKTISLFYTPYHLAKTNLCNNMPHQTYFPSNKNHRHKVSWQK